MYANCCNMPENMNDNLENVLVTAVVTTIIDFKWLNVPSEVCWCKPINRLKL